MKIWHTSEGKFLPEAQLCANGFALDPECPGFACRPDKEYAESVSKIRVHVSAIDGAFTKTLSPKNAVNFIRSEFDRETLVSSDGVTWFGGIEYRCENSRHFYPASLAELLAAV